MPSRDELTQLFAFKRWANRQAVDALATTPEPSDEGLRLGWHILVAIDHWLSRIEGSEPMRSLDWRAPSLDELRGFLPRVEARMDAFLEHVTDVRLGEQFAYVNTSGERYTNRVGDALQHVLLHSAEHRGQLFLEGGRFGGTPVETEYAWFLREGRAGESSRS